MASKNGSNAKLFIDKEAVSALALVKEGLLAPVKQLMGKEEAEKVDRDGMVEGKSFPFSFILAPSGKVNQQVLQNAKKGDILDLTCENHHYGRLVVDDVFPIDPQKRAYKIYGSTDLSHPGLQRTLKRLGNYAVSGEYTIEFDDIRQTKETIQAAQQAVDATHTTAMMIAAKPLHRAHERMIRLALDKTDLLIIFLLKPYGKDDLHYNLRLKTVNHLIENFLPKNRVVVVPLENTYLFAGNNEMILDAIVAQNFGCDRLITGQNHVGLGVFYDHNEIHSVFDTLKGLSIELELMAEFVYCNLCRTLVSVRTCPHGHHHHISYHSGSIMELLRLGLMPPAVLMRKEISAIILAHLFPGRFKNLERLYYDILPATGLIEEHNEEEFYIELMQLYQTSSLT